MQNRTTNLPPHIPQHITVFRCKVDKLQYILPLIVWCILDVIILIVTPNILLGIFIVLLSIVPIGVALLYIKLFWGRVTYIIDDKELRVTTSLKSMSINIERITKIIRVKEFFISHKGRDFSASYIKLRIIYDRSSYIYVSPENESEFISILKAINPDIAYSIERGLYDGCTPQK